MSIAEIERFAADLQSSEALRAEAGQAPAETSVVAFAASKGYAFTADDVKDYAKARKLTDAELDGVAGGIGAVQSEGEVEKQKGMNEALVAMLAKTSSSTTSDRSQQLRTSRTITESGASV